MPYQSHLPLNQGMLSRPRLDSLIKKGLEKPLLVLLAGPGYGKTQAMAAHLASLKARILWLRLNSLDNLDTHFWPHLVRGLKQVFPALSKYMKTLEFPDDLPKFDAFLNILSKDIGPEKQAIWVFDDFGEITDPRIKKFFRMMTESEPDNLRLVLLTNISASLDALSLNNDRKFIISGEDLRFTKEEISGLYAKQGLPLETEEVRRIEHYTEGWALPLHLLSLQQNKTPDFHGSGQNLSHREIGRLFEERFFSSYAESKQKLFVKLSLLDSFGRELLAELYEGPPADLNGFDSHFFIINEPATGRFFFHHLYNLFLQEKKYLLSPGEELIVWKKAAEYYEASGDFIAAIACYRNCGDRAGMLNVICSFFCSQYGITGGSAEYFLKHLDLLSPGELQEYPVADYLRALIYLNMVELEKAETLLIDLEQRLLEKATPEALVLLGDTYAIQGAIHMMRNQEDFGEYYKKASGYLPEGTKFKNKDKLFCQNIHNFSMADNQPGARERMERAVHEGVPWMSQVLTGGMSGMEHIFSAEAAYLTYQIADAEQYAYRGIYKAEANAQHDLVCNGFCILARVAFIRGNFGAMSRHIQSLVDYADRFEIPVLKEIRDTALAWYYIKLRDFGKIPKTILTINDSEQRLLAYGRTQIVYANYLINTEEYAKLVGMLEYPKGLYLTRGIWPDRICLFIMLAIGYHRLGNPEAAIEALWTAYDMCYNNKLTTLFVEAERFMPPLVALARKQTAYAFEPQWLDSTVQLAENFSKRAAAVRTSYKKQNVTKTGKENPLTKREEEILQELSRGLTREEIAVEHSISLNTVKSFIRGIYNKLDATNRAEAVSIAILNNYIEAPGVE